MRCAASTRRLGLSPGEVASLCASCPSLLVSSIEEKLEPTAAYLRGQLGCPAPLLRKLLTRGGVLTRSLGTVQVGGERRGGRGWEGQEAGRKSGAVH